MYKKYQLIYIIISFSILLINKSECAIYLPFKILENDIYNDNKPLNVIRNLNESKLFSELYIGTPPTKIGVLFVSNIYELTIFQNMCDIPNSFYNKQNSSSQKHIKKINYLFNKVMNCSVITEKLYLYLDKEQKKNISIDDMMIFYSDNKKEEFNQDLYYKKDYEDREYEYHPNTCLNIGFQPRQNINFGGQANFVRQIRDYREDGKPIVNSYDYTFQFVSDTNGYLIIGEKAHEFDKNNYKEIDYILTAALNKDYNFDWFIHFSSIYYSGIFENNTEYKNTFKCNMSLKVDLTYGLFKGPIEYEDSIRKDFFDKLIKDKQCFMDENEQFRFYYCDKKLSYDYIQKYFPVLNFCLNEHGFCFSFDYKDLFKEKNDILYFMVYFNKTNNYGAFTAGQIFLKKYLLTFNYDSKMIGFYHNNLNNESNDKKGNENVDIYYYEHDIVAICIIAVVIILFFIIGYFVGKKIYDKTRKTKANELIDDYDYNTQDNNKKNEISINE